MKDVSVRMQKAFLMLALAAGLLLRAPVGALAVEAGGQALPNGGAPAPALFDWLCSCYCECVAEPYLGCSGTGTCYFGSRAVWVGFFNEDMHPCFCNGCFVFFAPSGNPKEGLSCLPVFGPHTDRMVQAFLQRGGVRLGKRR